MNENTRAANHNDILHIKFPPWSNSPITLSEREMPLIAAHIRRNPVLTTIRSSLPQNTLLNENNSPVTESSDNTTPPAGPFVAKELLSDKENSNNSNIQETDRFSLTAERLPTETKIKANVHKKMLVNKPQQLAIKRSNATKDLIKSTTMAKSAKEKSPSLPQPIANEISSSFGKRIDPIGNTVKFHKGIDISRPPGTEVFAWSDGVISGSGWLRGYGLTVDVTHADGMKTRYAHLMRTTVQKGQKIDKGQIVGQVGKTGRTTGSNLHFEVAVAGKITDPQDHLSKITEIVGDDVGVINNG